MGSQLKRAGRVVQDGDVPTWDPQKIQGEAAKSGTKWVLVEAGSHWRNGLVERQIRSLKRSLYRVMESNSALNFAELDTLFACVSNTVNQRRLGVRSRGEDDFRASPQMICSLVGQTRCSLLPSMLLVKKTLEGYSS